MQDFYFLYEKNITMNFSSNSTPAKLYDHHDTYRHNTYIASEEFQYFFYYAILVPFSLFFFSQLIRCVRRRGWISRRSERRMVDNLEGRLRHVPVGNLTPMILSDASNILSVSPTPSLLTPTSTVDSFHSAQT